MNQVIFKVCSELHPGNKSPGGRALTPDSNSRGKEFYKKTLARLSKTPIPRGRELSSRHSEVEKKMKLQQSGPTCALLRIGT